MIKLACPIPRDVVVAFSGGPDSSALLDFCIRGKKNVIALHIDHLTPHAKDARKFVEDYCRANKIRLEVRQIDPETEHNEDAWREQRRIHYHEWMDNGFSVATGHTLDDLVEWYLYSTIHGKPKFMKPTSEIWNLIKPFLYNEKQSLLDWCSKFNVPYITDPTNLTGDNMRAKMRSKIIPGLLEIYPGMKTSIKKKAMEE